MISVNFTHLKILKGLFVLHVHFTGGRHWPWPILSMILTIYAQYVPRHLAASQQPHANTLESGLQKLCTQLLQIEGSLRDGTYSTHRIRCGYWYHISVPGAQFMMCGFCVSWCWGSHLRCGCFYNSYFSACGWRTWLQFTRRFHVFSTVWRISVDILVTEFHVQLWFSLPHWNAVYTLIIYLNTWTQCMLSQQPLFSIWIHFGFHNSRWRQSW